jgi:hypothetical protein
MTFTGAPMTVAGSSKALPASTVEFTFAVELCGPGTGVASGTAPEFDSLLLACGLEKDNVFFYDVDATTFDGTFFNKENIDGTTGGAYSSSVGKSFGDNAFGDGDFLATSATALTGGSTYIAGQRSGKLVEADALAATQIGVGYRPKSANSDDTNADTSVTIRLYLDKAGSYVEGVGCRGTFDIAFVHGDRALINFTFQGTLNAYVEDSDPTEYNYTMEVPPAWINTGLQFGLADSTTANYAGALFNALTFTLGNEMTMHENTNQRSGYRSAIIGALDRLRLLERLPLRSSVASAVDPGEHCREQGGVPLRCRAVHGHHGRRAGHDLDPRLDHDAHGRHLRLVPHHRGRHADIQHSWSRQRVPDSLPLITLEHPEVLSCRSLSIPNQLFPTSSRTTDLRRKVSRRCFNFAG